MKFFYWLQHLQQAQEILSTWVSLQNQSWILRASLIALERKLKLHLAILSKKTEDLPKPATPLQAAINLAAQRDSELNPNEIKTLLFEQGAYSYVVALNKLFDLKKCSHNFLKEKTLIIQQKFLI